MSVDTNIDRKKSLCAHIQHGTIKSELMIESMIHCCHVDDVSKLFGSHSGSDPPSSF